MPHPVMDPTLAAPFPKAALPMLRNTQLRKNVGHATDVIQASEPTWLRKRPTGNSCDLRPRHPRPRP